ncbi:MULTISPECIES: hypothetical protein [Bacillus]|uniref:hypothetical protein n=1 Tax=Bacillus TaxID=1386 RepID=UPI00033099FF|nr:hypothetical protein [Bacillus wiedmannii]EOP09644.1 hypothetical protein ICS_03387 [Bacillus cereus BAG2O-3]EOQ12566.1 hypothetical protein KQ3_01507 [Bacillus cereus B5-2]MBJ8115289.1 hypothetical protein [Bacillus cereus]PFW85582.1 hypothetical protein COL27_07130 [Bacillus sp. AFS075960]RFB26709.1 hypothetical protein DZB85_00460 [Bacillus sp. LB(2018)]RFB47621.1 hypothetical protein DZB83_10285 [Bacillus sp. dmp10]RFB74807.1 hypothetical protein DZB94_12475 [Bacillus sp. AW]HDR81723
MQNEWRCETEIVDTKETLPFVLKLIIGTEAKGEYILLNRLCTSTTALVQCIYKVQELKPLRLHYHYESPMDITFIWNKVYEGQKNIKESKYEINEKKQKVLIYEHGKTEFFYPWRCGLYHFEVRIEDTTYYGAFQVVPKNFFDDQFEMIQNYVKSILNELILDRGYYKKTFSALSDIEDSSYLVLLRKLPQKMKKIKQIFKKIESSSKFIHEYKWEEKERKATRKGTIVAERKSYAKYYNRKFIEQKNSKENAFLKFKAMQFYHYLLEAESFLRQTIEILERAKKKKSEEFQAVKTIIQTIERNGSVTDREKQKYKNIHLLKEADLRKSSMKIQEYKILSHFVHGSVQYFQTLMHSPFWREISETGNMNSHNLPIPHQQLLQHLDLLPQSIDQSPSLLFVYKPTFLVYEYYAFFIVISMLEQIGFEARNSIREQIQEHFYVDGLQDGTTVVLHRDDIRIHVAFNDLIETHPLIALSKGSNFYNGEDTKKPDIRLDCYVKEEGKYVYQSSIIIEVKYSPMYNIFQHVGNTKATEQMYKYWSIKYVEEQDGKRVYYRRAIYEVICVYPGSHMHSKKIESGCGVFLQLYPYKTKQGEAKLAGKNGMVQIFGKWLKSMKK